MRVLDLAGAAWTVTGRDPGPESAPRPGVPVEALVHVPAQVPGCIHTDLLRAGLIPDPYRQEQKVAWVAFWDWEYATTVQLDALHPGERADLVLEGVQTVADLEVNGQVVGTVANMHRRHRVDVGGALRAGTNRIVVRFTSAARAMRNAAGPSPLPHDWSFPSNTLRTLACGGGWDWGPTLVTAGLWRGVRLERWTGACADLDVTTVLDRQGARGELRVTADVRGEEPCELTIGCGDQRWVRPVRPGRTVLVLPVDSPEPWWPRGYGEPVLHEVQVELRTRQDQRRVAACTRRVGFRHVELDTSADAAGRAFTLRVNGTAVFARGANWIPDDLLISRMTPARYAERIEQACAAHMNTLRVWGGGLYEDEAFYTACDERGVLVWQDFLFACAAYPEEEPLRAEVIAEADQAVRRIAAHPSVVLWCGGNECLLGWEDWGWPERVAGRTWGEAYYRDLLPRAVADYAPGAVYVANTPVSTEPGVHPQVPGDGTVHLWDVWNLQDYAHYREEIPRFVAEFGYQAPASWSTLTRAVGPLPDRPDDLRLLAHQKQPGGEQHLVDRLAGRFPAPQDIATDTARWHLATQLNQAHALRTGIEHFRSWWPRTAGALVWQLNDVWPAISWSLVDHDGVPKPAWYAVRRAFADRLVTVQPREAGLSVLLINDSDRPWTDELVVRRVHLRDAETARVTRPVEVRARSVLTVPIDRTILQAHHRRDELVVADVRGADSDGVDGARRAVHALAREDGVRWPRTGLSHRIRRISPEGVEVTVRAQAAAGDVSLYPDRLDPAARVDSALIWLMPGESHTFTVTAPGEVIDRIADRLPETLRARNELFHG